MGNRLVRSGKKAGWKLDQRQSDGLSALKVALTSRFLLNCHLANIYISPQTNFFFQSNTQVHSSYRHLKAIVIPSSTDDGQYPGDPTTPLGGACYFCLFSREQFSAPQRHKYQSGQVGVSTGTTSIVIGAKMSAWRNVVGGGFMQRTESQYEMYRGTGQRPTGKTRCLGQPTTRLPNLINENAAEKI
ncbi:hypothetical protein RRG08_033946 [Elysia crispata]|uniref:Uncharacterized protein n=1 Tax=Elysia crispata TaxID=231223 RepID=A0AAE0YRK4_9GAST|nr:hypothetical protein RRG08_033946 [Elysia crispata]